MNIEQLYFEIQQLESFDKLKVLLLEDGILIRGCITEEVLVLISAYPSKFLIAVPVKYAMASTSEALKHNLISDKSKALRASFESSVFRKLYSVQECFSKLFRLESKQFREEKQLKKRSKV